MLYELCVVKIFTRTSTRYDKIGNLIPLVVFFFKHRVLGLNLEDSLGISLYNFTELHRMELMISQCNSVGKRTADVKKCQDPRVRGLLQLINFINKLE